MAAAAVSPSSASPGSSRLRARRRMPPHARQTIRLEFLTHRLRIGAGCARARRPRQIACQVLDVMADLVRDDVGLREVSRRAEPPVELPEETQIEIDPLIARAVKRSSGRPRLATCGVHGVGEQHEHGFRVLLSRTLENRGPRILGIRENFSGEFAGGIGTRWSGRRAGRWRAACAHARIVEELTRVHAEEVADDQQQDDAADAKPSGTARPKSTAAHAAAIFDVLTLSRVVQAHGGPSMVTERCRHSTLGRARRGFVDNPIMLPRSIALLIFGSVAFVSSSRAQDDPNWTRSFPPFRIIGNIYWVGSYDLSTT